MGKPLFPLIYARQRIDPNYQTTPRPLAPSITSATVVLADVLVRRIPPRVELSTFNPLHNS